MVREDLNPICSNNNGSTNGYENGGGSSRSSSSKKLKQKKLPQRGLGVAQLEKIRIEEQKKDDNFSPPSTISSTNSLTLPTSPLRSYAHSNNNGKKSKSTVPCSPPSPPPPPPLHLSLRSPTPSTRNHSNGSMPNIESFQFASIPPLNPTNGGGFSIKCPTIPVNDNVNLPKLWLPLPHEYSLSHKINSDNMHFPTNLSLPYETCSIAPPPLELVPKVNGVLIVSSSSSSSVLSFPTEPPSNQSFNSNYSSLWQDGEKIMVGMKRTCPFPLDDPPIPIFQNGKFASIANHTLSRAGESDSCRNGGTTTYNLDPAIPIFRDLPPWSIAIPEPASSNKSGKTTENGHSNGGLLSLAPPTITNPLPNAKFKETSMLLPMNNREFCNFETLPYQVNFHESLINSRQGGSSQQANCHSFFPPAKVHAPPVAPPANRNSCNGEVGESIDLNLKL